MTINIALVTSDALILGCDSTASQTQYYLNPFQIGFGAPGANGKMPLEFDYDDIEQIVTNAWSGVTKMFTLCEWGDCHVAAVTAGLAALNEKPISVIADEFHASLRPKGKGQPQKRTVRDVAEQFLGFVRAEYDSHYATSTSIPAQFKEGPEFLVGGVCSQESFPSCYRVRVKENTVTVEFASGSRGLCWNGQADAVERVIRGYDRQLKRSVQDAFSKAVADYQYDMNAAVVRIIDDILTKLNVSMPPGVDTTLPNQVASAPDWDSQMAVIPYGALPLRSAVNFVGYLVTMQAGKMLFASGIATVGGRTHVGVITRGQGIQKLNEPELTHLFTGFTDDQ